MRQFQIGVFIFGVLLFLAAIFFIGEDMGDTLWRAGVAALIIDIVCIKLWPATKPQ